MDNQGMLDYVVSSSAVLRLPIDEARAKRVSEILARTAIIASGLDGVELTAAVELAEIFRPAPFPQADARLDADSTS